MLRIIAMSVFCAVAVGGGPLVLIAPLAVAAAARVAPDTVDRTANASDSKPYIKCVAIRRRPAARLKTHPAPAPTVNARLIPRKMTSRTISAGKIRTARVRPRI